MFNKKKKAKRELRKEKKKNQHLVEG